MPEHFAFIGSDDPKSPGSVLLWSENSRLLFNCPEGCQRFFGEISERLVAVSHVFFTQFTPHHTMGFPGMLFTINDAGVQKINTTSPNNSNIKNNNNNNEDEMQRWWGVLRKNYYSRDRIMNLKSINDVKTHSFPTFTVTTIVSSSNSSCQSYLIQGLTSLKFDPAQAKKLGVNPGIKFSQLKSGETVESDAQKGVFVKPEQVLIANEQAEAEERTVFLADYHDDPKEYFESIKVASNEMENNNSNNNTDEDKAPAVSSSSLSSSSAAASVNTKNKIHTVIHLARFPNPFLVQKMMLERSSESGESIVSSIEELRTNNEKNGANTVKGMPLFWTEKIFIKSSKENSNNDDDSGSSNSYYIRRHIISPQCCPPDGVRITAFPTSLAMRMHLRAVTKELFTDKSIRVQQQQQQQQQQNTSSSSYCWPYGASCFLKLRIAPEVAQTSDCSGGLFRFPSNHLLLPTEQSALEMLSPELRKRFIDYNNSTTSSTRAQAAAAATSEASSFSPFKWLSFGGTGSAVPNKYRNVSSIGLQYFSNMNDTSASSTKSILFDCGEGTTGQFSLTLGQSGFADFISPSKLKFIFISHMHADHHFGLFSILSMRRDMMMKEDILRENDNNGSSIIPSILPIIAPNEVIVYFKDLLNDWGVSSSNNNNNSTNNQDDSAASSISTTTSSSTCVNFNTEVGRLNRHYLFIDSEEVVLFLQNAQNKNQQSSIEDIVLNCTHHNETEETRRQINLNFSARKQNDTSTVIPQIRVVKVDHPGSAHGIRVDFVTKKNISSSNNTIPTSLAFPQNILYTGDTRPCDAIIDAIAEHPTPLDVLIHESTFDSSMKEEAAMKMHSTVDEAISVATAPKHNGKVKFLMLNHFSQRYPKLSAGAKIDDNENDKRDTKNNNNKPKLAVGASCDLLYLEGNIDRFLQLRDAIPYFGELLEEYEKFAGGGSLSRRLRSGMTAIDKTPKKVDGQESTATKKKVEKKN